MNATSLADAKTGDTILFNSWNPYDHEPARVVKITHCTATQIHVGALKFNRSDGRCIPRSSYGYHNPSIRAHESPERTAAVIAEWNTWRDRKLLSNFRQWPKLTPDQISRMAAILNEPTP
jgi:hypothetical protein